MIQLPNSNEYGSYYANYIKLIEEYIEENNTKDVVQVLSKLGKATKEIFSQFSETDALFKYAEEKWSIKELLGHMIDTEQIMSYRALAFYRGEKQPLVGFDQDEYIEEANFDVVPYSDLLERYEAVRNASITLFKSFEANKTKKIGEASGNKMSVRGLIYMIAGHEIHHLNILKERYIK